MPVEFTSFEGRVLTIREIGHISIKDAQHYADLVRSYAGESEKPIVVIIDALEMTGFDPQASLVFVNSSTISNVLGYLVISADEKIRGESRRLGRQNIRRNTLLFNTLEEAQQHASKLLADDAPEKPGE